MVPVRVLEEHVQYARVAEQVVNPDAPILLGDVPEDGDAATSVVVVAAGSVVVGAAYSAASAAALSTRAAQNLNSGILP